MLIRGWMFVGFSKEYGAGQVCSRRFMGEEYVLFRTASGQLSIVQAHCQHLGVHLGEGKVHGDCIQCPMHGRCYHGDGRPADARHRPLPSPPLAEDHGLVFAYFDEPGAAPAWPAPRYFEEERATWRLLWSHAHEYRGGHPSQFLENGVDARHFGFTHPLITGRVASPSVFTSDGHRARTLGAIHLSPLLDRLHKGATIPLDFQFDGPLNVAAPAQSFSTGRRFFGLHFTTILEEGRYLFTTAEIAHPGATLVQRAKYLLDSYGNYAGSRMAMREDRPLWNRRRHLVDPDLYPDEGAIADYRRWFAQFELGACEPHRRAAPLLVELERRTAAS